MMGATVTTSEEWEFAGVFMQETGTRPMMSRPPAMRATRKLRDMLRDAIAEHGDSNDGYDLADWLADLLERFGAAQAHGSFDIGDPDGSGPQCSWCGGIWPLCGHGEISRWVADQERALAEDQGVLS